MRVAAVDVGTNSVHLLVADVGTDGQWTVVEKDRTQVELGSGGIGSNRIDDAAFERGQRALESFAQACHSLGVKHIHCAATSAVREAENGDDFCRVARRRSGIRVRTISGIDEARLIYLGAKSDLDFSQGRVLLMDLGGGSTEFVLCGPEKIHFAKSVEVGHIRLADAKLDDPMSEASYNDLKRTVKAAIKPVRASVSRSDYATLVGTSGTIRCLARMATYLRGDEPPTHSHGLLLRFEDLEALIHRFRTEPSDVWVQMPGADPRRQRTLPGGAMIVRQAMKALGAHELYTSQRSLRDGLLVEWLERNMPELALARTVPDPRRRAVVAMMERFGADTEHAQTVTRLALSLFDATTSVHRLGPVERDLLEAAALLHDIGHHIDGKNHNRHGQYLILNSKMGGWSAPEVSIIAALVRYHRGGRPKATHPEFAAMSLERRRKVRILAGILRFSDALDRSHNQPIDEVEVTVSPSQLRVSARAHGAAHMERWAATRRTDLLASALHRDVVLTIDDIEVESTVS